jgi:hypothetical protein
MDNVERVARADDGAFPEKLTSWAQALSVVCSRRHIELSEQGLSDTEARTSIIHDLIACASGEACRIARKEGRDPDINKWRAATERAFLHAVERTLPAPPQHGGVDG